MGMNAILVFFFHGTAEAIIDAVYWTPNGHPGQWDGHMGGGKGERQAFLNWWKNDVMCEWIDDAAWCDWAYVASKMVVWFIACWYLVRIKYFWKI